MAVTLPNKGKGTNMRRFTALGGDTKLFKITEEASPEIFALAQLFPKAVWNALFMLGGHTRKRMRRAVNEGGTSAHRWLGLSDLHRYRRMDRLKAGEFPRKSYKGVRKRSSAGVWTSPGLIARSKDSPESRGVFGRVAQTLAFHAPKGNLVVEIGALSPSAAKFISAVQEGKWGGKGSFQFRGRQTVTPAMRRALWAAGFPLSGDTTVIGHEGRPLVPPVFEEIHPEIERYVVCRITEYLARRGIDWMQQ